MLFLLSGYISHYLVHSVHPLDKSFCEKKTFTSDPVRNIVHCYQEREKIKKEKKRRKEERKKEGKGKERMKVHGKMESFLFVSFCF